MRDRSALRPIQHVPAYAGPVSFDRTARTLMPANATRG